MIPSDERERRFVEAWRKADAFLAAERVQRLRRMTDDECRAEIHRIFSVPLPPQPPRPSGLLEMQRLFRKLR